MAELQWPPIPGLDLKRPSWVGRIFYVRSTGQDTPDRGVSPNNPLQTVTYALTLCTDWMNDYIVLMNNTSAFEAAFPIAVSKNLVHIVGLWGAPYPNPTLISDAGNPVFELQGEWIEIAGIEMGVADVNAPCIATTSWSNPASAVTIGHWWIHHNTFGWIVAQTLGQDGILISATDDAPQCFIEDNYFGGPVTGNGLARDGIRIDHNMTRSVIRRNVFRYLSGGIGINVNKNGTDLGEISKNYFYVARGSGPGSAITFVLGAGNALVVDNKAMEDGEGPTTPFRDLSTAAAATTLNGWGVNWVGITAAYPVLA